MNNMQPTSSEDWTNVMDRKGGGGLNRVYMLFLSMETELRKHLTPSCAHETAGVKDVAIAAVKEDDVLFQWSILSLLVVTGGGGGGGGWKKLGHCCITLWITGLSLEVFHLQLPSWRATSKRAKKVFQNLKDIKLQERY